MNETAVSDTGPLLHLSQIGRGEVLNIFREIAVTPEVQTELSRRSIWESLSTELNARLKVVRADETAVGAMRKSLSAYALQDTDLTVAALAETRKPDVVLTDDLPLRRALLARKHQVAGSIGVVVRAFTAGVLTKAQMEASLDALLNGSTLYLSKGLRARIRKLMAGL